MQPGLTLVESTGSLRRAGCPCPAGMVGLGRMMLLTSLLDWGEDLGDPDGAKERDLKGFVGIGVPRANRVSSWRHAAWGKESVGVGHQTEVMKQNRVTRREAEGLGRCWSPHQS